MKLKERFLNAVISGELGTNDDNGAIVSLREFKDFFKDLNSDYVNSFLPASTIEKGQITATETKFLFRISKGIYAIHPDIIQDLNNLKNKHAYPLDIKINHYLYKK